jgi:hypothetical protein
VDLVLDPCTESWWFLILHSVEVLALVLHLRWRKVVGFLWQEKQIWVCCLHYFWCNLILIGSDIAHFLRWIWYPQWFMSLCVPHSCCTSFSRIPVCMWVVHLFIGMLVREWKAESITSSSYYYEEKGLWRWCEFWWRKWWCQRMQKLYEKNVWCSIFLFLSLSKVNLNFNYGILICED